MDNNQTQNNTSNSSGIFSQPVDQQALTLTHAIALQESGSGGKPNYNATGDAGTSKGAYQWQPGNFEAAAKAAGLDPTDFSPQNQDKVAYSEVKAYKDKGYDPGQIASLWNSGSPNNWQTHSGTTTINGKEISYDTPSYVKGVQKYYQQLAKSTGTSSGSGGLPNLPSAAEAPGVSGSSSTPAPATQGDQGITGDLDKGDYGGAANDAVQGLGNTLTLGGSGQLGNSIGTGLGYGYEKLKGLFGGQDNSAAYKKYEMPGGAGANALSGSEGLLKTLLGGATTAVGGEGAQGAVSTVGKVVKAHPLASLGIGIALEHALGPKIGGLISHLLDL